MKIEQWMNEYCERQGYELASRIDEKMAALVKKKPRYFPQWLWNKVIGYFLTIINIK